VKFLEAIEKGKFSMLPQTYVRAFLREFASAVGADPVEVLRQYDDVSAEKPKAVAGEQKPSPRPEPRAQAMPEPQQAGWMTQPNILRWGAFGLVLVAGLAVILILNNNTSTSTQNSPPASEIPFDRVVKETEAATPPVSVAARDTTAMLALAPDSLRLQIQTTDSVWVSILIDGKKTEQYLFPPKRKRTWAAKERFAVTMGNAGGATFALNGKEIGALGKRGAVVRNAVITESTLQAP